jgi:uncharacterized cupredoxin-like copper-binding protein
MKKIIILAGLFFTAACGGSETSADEPHDAVPVPKESIQEEAGKDMAVNDDGFFEIQLRTIGETMADMEYEPKQIKVPSGSNIRIVLQNEAETEAMIHNFVLIERGKSEEIYPLAQEAGPDANYVPVHASIYAASPLAQPGKTVEVEFETPAAGIYQFICTYPGHSAMKGIFIVE